MNKVTLKDAARFLKNCGNTYILIHQSPDGDCIGAGFAVKYYLEATGRKARVLCHDEIPKRFSYMTDENNSDFEPDNIMSVDVADNKLFGDDLRELYGDRVEMSIDHHFSAKLFARETYVEPAAAAACEILVRVFEEIGFDLTEKMAKCLYTGISTDTGCFQYSNAGAETHRVTARIMERHPETDYAWINRQMFIVKSRQRLEMEMLAVRSMKTYFDDRCAVIAITKEMAESLGVDMNDIEGVANIPLQLETAVIGITMKEREPGLFKVSMRSTEAANVAEICEALGGGGHERAAGCTVRGSLEEARELIIETVRKRAGLF